MEIPKRIVGDDGELLFDDENAHHSDHFNRYSFSYDPIIVTSYAPRPSFLSRLTTLDGWALTGFFTTSALIAFMILMLLLNALVMRFEDRHSGADLLPTQAPCAVYYSYWGNCKHRY